MRAVVWKGEHHVAVEEVPDPVIREPTDAIIEVTSTGICGSDLHLYEAMGAFLDAGDILGHEAMGRVVEVGSQVRNVSVGDRVVIPFNISCGTCFMCDRGLQSQCETTQVRSEGSGAALFGYTKLYGQVPGGQAEYLRVPQAQYGPIRVPDGPSDDRFVYLSDVLPTAWQAVAYADVPTDGTLLVLGLGPIGDMCTRVARQLGVERVIGVERVPERVSRVQARGVTVLEMDAEDEIVEGGPRPDRRPRRRRRDRRGRDGGPRLAVGPGGPGCQHTAARRRQPRDACAPSGSTSWRSCAPRSLQPGAAARSRSSGSTAARPTRCRC